MALLLLIFGYCLIDWFIGSIITEFGLLLIDWIWVSLLLLNRLIYGLESKPFKNNLPLSTPSKWRSTLGSFYYSPSFYTIWKRIITVTFTINITWYQNRGLEPESSGPEIPHRYQSFNPVQIPNRASGMENLEQNDLDVPIALPNWVRTCTKHLIANYVKLRIFFLLV